MIDKVVYEIDYIRKLQRQYVSDPGLIDSSIAFFLTLPFFDTASATITLEG